jgi:hypothetical protein
VPAYRTDRPSLEERLWGTPPPSTKKPLLERIEFKLPAKPTGVPDQPPRPIASRVSGPLPLVRTIDIDFKKKSKESITAIFDRRLTATITRVQALFDRKERFERLPLDIQDKCHAIANRLNWLSEHVHTLHAFLDEHLRGISWGLQIIGQIPFTPLSGRFVKASHAVAALETQGYFSCVPNRAC